MWFNYLNIEHQHAEIPFKMMKLYLNSLFHSSPNSGDFLFINPFCHFWLPINKLLVFKPELNFSVCCVHWITAMADVPRDKIEGINFMYSTRNNSYNILPENTKLIFFYLQSANQKKNKNKTVKVTVKRAIKEH